MTLKLINVFLTDLSCNVDLPSIMATQQQGEISISTTSTLVTPVEKEDNFIFSLTLNSASNDSLFKFGTTYSGIFQIDKLPDLNTPKGSELAKECMSILFPYIRELLADITRKLPFASPVVLDFSFMDEITQIGKPELVQTSLAELSNVMDNLKNKPPKSKAKKSTKKK